MPAQWNLILIYKYFPFALLALTAFLKQPDYRSGVTLGVAGSLASASFQTVYPLFAAAVFTTACAAVLLRQKRLVLPPFGVAALTAGLFIWGNISLIPSGWKLARMTAVPRLSVGGWTMI